MKTTTLLALALCIALASCQKATTIIYAPVSTTISANSTGTAYSLDSIRVALVNSSGTTVATAYPTSAGTVDLGNQPTGSYTIRATAREISVYYVLGIYSTDTTHPSGSCTLTTPTQTGCDITLQ